MEIKKALVERLQPARLSPPNFKFRRGFESIFFPDCEHSVRETRFFAVGYVDHKCMFVVFTIRAIQGKLKLRVVSARRANRKEIGVFFEEKN